MTTISWRDASTPTSATDYAPNVTVFHRLYGVGTVLRVSGQRVWVRFLGCSTMDDVVMLSATVARAPGMMVAVSPMLEELR